MRVLVVGNGGREHALAWKIKQSPRVDTLFIAPGNGGTAFEGINVPISAGDIDSLVAFARKEHIDLVVAGPELPLTSGITDAMAKAGIRCFGPSKWCAQIEGSKSFAKSILEEAGVPTAAYGAFTNAEEAKEYIRKQGAPIVVKADGLAAGKGVVVAQTESEALDAVDMIMGGDAFGEAGSKVVIEEFLEGEEVSLLAFCDGEYIVPLPSAQDHKAAYDGDKGANTGGMGAYSPAPILPDSNLATMADTVIQPILREMKRQGHPYVGILYAGLMMTLDGPKVLEYNARFGDPECEPLLMRLDCDLVDVMMACITGTLSSVPVKISSKAALGVVIAAEGYPAKYEKGIPISGIEQAEEDGAKVFHAGTSFINGELVSSGGRVLCVTALGDSLKEAQQNAYKAVGSIRMERSRFRSDIGAKGLRHLNGEL